MSITSKFIIMGLAAACVLAFIWWRTRGSALHRRASRSLGTGLTDEMAAAVEDVASEFIRAQRDNEAKRPTPRNSSTSRGKT